MSKKTIRIISTLLTIAMVIMMTASIAFAADNSKPSQFATGGSDVTNGALGSMGKNIVATIRTVAMIAAVIVLMVLGIKYMMGSAEEKASYKKTMMPYIVGAVLVFGAGFVVDAVFDFASGLNTAKPA